MTVAGGTTPTTIDVRRALRDTIKVARATWTRSVGVALAVTLAFVGVLVLAVCLLSELALRQADRIYRDGEVVTSGVLALVIQVSVPTLAAGAFLTVMTLAAGITLADDHLAGKRSTTASALSRALRRSLSALLAMTLAALGVLGAVAATPLLMTGGLLGLLATPLVRTISRRTGRRGRWPSTRALATALVPFAPAALLAARWALVLPAASLEVRGPRSALARSHALIAGRATRAALLLFGVMAVYVGSQFGLAHFAGWTDQNRAFWFGRWAFQILSLSVPLAMAAVVFRQLAGPTDPDHVVPTPTPRLPTRILTTSVLVTVAVVAGSLTMRVSVAAAEDAPADAQEEVAPDELIPEEEQQDQLAPDEDATEEDVHDDLPGVTFQVDALGDEGDAVPGDATCATAEGSCTLRAAVEEISASPVDDLTVAMTTSGTITLMEPLEITTSFHLDAGANRVSLSGSTALLRFSNPSSSFSLANLTFEGASGAAIETAAQGELRNVTFIDNQSGAPGGAIAVVGGWLSVDNATFHGNAAPVGADIAVSHGAGASVTQSTFVGGSSSAVDNAGGELTIYSSIITSNGEAVCSGPFNGGINLAPDGQCNANDAPTGLAGLGDNGGPVLTVALSPDSNAIDAGNPEGCSGSDARGMPRPQGERCDIGAYESEFTAPAGTILVVDDLGDDGDADPGDRTCATTLGTCTLRAAAEEISALDGPPARIEFGIAGTVTVAEPVVLNRDVVLTGNGNTVTVSGGGSSRILQTPTPAEVTIEGLTLADGHTDEAGGGGALRSSAFLTTDAVTFRDNVASTVSGGAVAVAGGTATFRNTTFWQNQGVSGSDVWISSTDHVAFENSTLVGGHDGSVANDDIDVAYLYNTIVAPASGVACVGPTEGASNLSSDQSCRGSLPVDGAELGIGAFGDHGGSVPTVALLAGSAAIDAVGWGTSFYCPASDARGIARPDGACDIGAYEYVDGAAIGPATVVLSADPDAPAMGQSIHLTATVSAADAGWVPDGVVQFATGSGSLGSAAVDVGGVAELTVPSLPVGEHVITASFEETSTLGGGSDALLVVVDKAATTVQLTSSVNPSIVRGSVQLTAAVGVVSPGSGPATGSVEFRDGAVVIGVEDVVDGVATLTTSSLAVGVRPITAEYQGDAQRKASTSDLHEQVVNAAGATMTLSAAATSVHGQAVTVTATVTPLVPGHTATGSVSFTLDGAPLGSAPITDGTATLTAPLGGAGAHTLLATYAGTSEIRPAVSDPSSHQVTRASTTVTLTASAPSSNHGDPVTVTVSVRPVAPGGGQPVGHVVLLLDTTEVARGALDPTGRYSLTLDDMAGGSRSFVAIYEGSADHAASGSAELIHEVRRWPTAISLSTAPDPVFGEDVGVEVTVTSPEGGPAPVGFVAVTLGSTTAWFELGLDGRATGTVRASAAGSLSVLARFWPSDSHEGSVTATRDLTVAKAPTTVGLDGPATSARGQAVTLVAQVAATGIADDAPSGTVTFRTGDTVLGLGTVNGLGVAELTVDDLPVGTHQLVASFSGDDFGSSNSAALRHQVVPAQTSLVLTHSPTSSAVGQPVTFTATVTSLQGASVPAGTVVWTIDETELGRASLGADGTASLTTTSVPVGPRTVVASFFGDGDHADSSDSTVHQVSKAATSVALTVTPAGAVTGQPVTYAATVVVLAPGEAIPTGTVTFTGADERAVPVGADGVARLTVPAPAIGAGLQVVTATYSGDPATARSEATITHPVGLAAAALTVAATATTVTMGDGLQLEVTVAAAAPSTVAPSTGTLVVRRNGTAFATVSMTGASTVVDVTTPDGLPVGTHAVTAELVGAPGFGPSRSSSVSVVVVPRSPVVTLASSPNPSVLGQPVTYEVAVSGGPTHVFPAGSIRVFDGATEIASASVTGLGSGWGARLTSAAVGIGPRSLVAVYTSTTNAYRDASSEPHVQVVDATPTTTSFVERSVMAPGERTTWTVHVRNTGPDGPTARATPTGSVTFSIAGSVFATVPLTAGPLPGWSRATVTSPHLDAGIHQILASYVPTGSFAPSQAVLDQPVGKIQPRIELTPHAASTTWGSPFLFSARVVVPGGSITLPAPTGQITISSPGGGACVVSAAGGACTLQWSDPGLVTVTATYAGDATHLAATSDALRMVVAKRTPTIAGSVSSRTPDTGTPVTMTWAVTGPTGGAVSARLGATTCPTTLSGTCTATPSVEDARSVYLAGVTFDGDPHWNPVRWAGDVRPVACIAVRLTVEFGEGGTLTTATPPNCGGGTGYRQGTWIDVVATPATSDDPGYDWYLHSLQPGGGTFPRQIFLVGSGGSGGSATDVVVAQFRKRTKCATVTLESEALPGATGRLVSLSDPNCPAEARGDRPSGWQIGSTGRTAQFTVGSTVMTDIVGTDAETEVYGYRRGWASPLSQQREDSFVVTGDMHVTAVLGPRCHDVEATSVGGTATITTARNCEDPRGPTGWRRGSAVVVVAAPDADRQTLDRWDGGGAERTVQVCSGCGDKGVDRLQYVTNFTVEPAPTTRRVTAHFVSCFTLDVQIQDIRSGGGQVTVASPGNCPGRPGTNWYRAGFNVGLFALDGFGARFAKWNAPDSPDGIPFTVLTMDQDHLVRPSFIGGNECKAVTLRSADPDRVLVSTEGSVEDLYCETGDLPGAPAPSRSGKRHAEAPLTMTAHAVAGDPLLGWLVEYAGHTLVTPGQQLTMQPPWAFTASAVPCVGLDARVRLTDPLGNTTIQQVDQRDLLGVWPPANCPYMDSAWMVGTEVYIAATADPRGFEFQGWTGAEPSGLPPELARAYADAEGDAASGADQVEDADELIMASVVLDGSRPIVDVSASYQVTCHQLTLTHDAKDVQVHPEANCPGYDPAEGHYIGGTMVLMQGRVPRDKIWVGWTGDVVQRGKVNPAQVIMDDDKSAGHRWRSKDLDDKIVEGLEWFGDQLAVGLKKAAGIAALVAAEILTSQPPLNVLVQMGMAAMALEIVLSAIGVPDDITQYLAYVHQTVTVLTAGLTCVATWAFSAGGDKGGAHLTGKLAGMAGNQALHGAEEAEDAARSLAELEAQRTFTGPDSRGFKALTTLEETTSFKVKAKLQFAKMKPVKAVVGKGLGVAMGAYGVYQNGEGFGWDASAEDAWTDWGAYNRCLMASVPGYIGLPGERDADPPPVEWSVLQQVEGTNRSSDEED